MVFIIIIIIIIIIRININSFYCIGFVGIQPQTLPDNNNIF